MAHNQLKQPRNHVSSAKQNIYIQHQFSGFRYKWRRGVGIWHGRLQPTGLSPSYLLEVTYPERKFPKVTILEPVLHRNSPHLYQDGSLCLFWPKEWKWSSDKIIADTIIPWSALWLYYYELWLDTDEWQGPSSHH